MKKIFAILTSLLFVVSVFGVASVMGDSDECCVITDVSAGTVRVGDYFTFTGGNGTTPTVTGNGTVVLVSGPTEVGCGTWITRYRAVSAGEVTIDAGVSYCKQNVTIISKELPFKFFAKLFGFGQTD